MGFVSSHSLLKRRELDRKLVDHLVRTYRSRSQPLPSVRKPQQPAERRPKRQKELNDVSLWWKERLDYVDCGSPIRLDPVEKRLRVKTRSLSSRPTYYGPLYSSALSHSARGVSVWS